MRKPFITCHVQRCYQQTFTNLVQRIPFYTKNCPRVKKMPNATNMLHAGLDLNTSCLHGIE